MGGVGSGGHNRVSAEAHILRGTFRPDRHAMRPERSTSGEVPSLPRGLKSAGRALWEAMTKRYDLDPGELALLEEACRTRDLIGGLHEPAELRAQRLTYLKLLQALRVPT